MKHYITVAPSGEILSLHTLQEDVDPMVSIGTNAIEVDLGIHPNSHWVSGGVFVSYSSQGRLNKLSPPHYKAEWNPTLESWVDVRSIEMLRWNKWDEIKGLRDAAEVAGFVWGGLIFDSDLISQQRIQGSVQLAQVMAAQGQSFDIDWTLKDNTVVTLSGADMISVGLALGQYINECHSKARLLRQQIESATTKEEIESIVWA